MRKPLENVSNGRASAGNILHRRRRNTCDGKWQHAGFGPRQLPIDDLSAKERFQRALK
jgi:hypothetical protein